MKKIRHLFAKGLATQFVLASFSRPALLEKETFSHFMNRLFSRLAPSYDRIGERLASESMALGPLSAALESLSDPPEKILDLACGTGLATLKVQSLFPDAKICGADISEKMIRELIRKTVKREVEKVSALICNSSRLPFKENGFDLVITQNAPPYPEEMNRVLVPGGRLVLAYSFVFDSLVRGVIRKRMVPLDPEEITFFQAQGGCRDGSKIREEGVMVLAHIESMAYGGYGVARIDNFVHFVPETAPGDVVEVRPVSRKKRYGFSQLVRLIEPSPWRVEPFCSYYGECGGCNLQHIAYAQQLEIKKNIFLDQLARVGKITDAPEPGIQGSETKRIRMRFQVQDGVVGLFRRKTHSVCLIHHCGVASEPVNALLQRLQAFELKGSFTQNRDITVLASSSEALISTSLPKQEARRLYNALGENVKGCTILARKKRLVLGKATLDIDLLGFQIAVPADSFWQVNPEINEIIVKEICDFMEGTKRVLDLYCGCGNMTLPLSSVCNEVIGIEKNASSIEAARHSLSRAGIGNVEFISSDASEAELATIDGLVLDPPRSGLQDSLLQKIEICRPRKIAYVSCNPSTLARDLQRMIEFGYSIRSVQLLDMFPHTHHIESLTLMQYPG